MDIPVTPTPDPLVGITNPWQFLAILREQIEKPDRPGYLKLWIDLVAKEDPLQQEALVKEGALVFGFTPASARQHLKDLAKKNQNGTEPEFAASITEGGVLAEMFYRPGDLELQTGFFVTYLDKPGMLPEVKPYIEVGGRKVYPFSTRMPRARMVYLPDNYEDYGSEEDLFGEILAYLQKYIQVDKPSILTITAAYIQMTWVYDCFQEIPYLRAQGDFGVGKSRYITVAGLACYRPTLAGGALTGPALFRLIEQLRGAVVIDEADFEPSTDIHHDITKMLNVGFQQRFPIIRNERNGDGFESQSFNVFGPKILATRRGFKDTALESRCFSSPLPLIDVNPAIPIFLDREFDQDVQKLRNKLLLWRFRRWGHVDIDSRTRFPGMEPRLNQIILPLLAVSHSAPMRGALLRAAMEATAAVTASRLQSLEGKIVETMLWLWWHRPKDGTRILLKSVVERLQSVGEIKEITSRKVSSILSNVLDIKTDYKGGNAWVSLIPAQVVRLVKHYHIDVPAEAVPEIPEELRGTIQALLPGEGPAMLGEGAATPAPGSPTSTSIVRRAPIL